MQFTAKQIADYLKGEIEGDEDAKVGNVAKIEEAQEGDITFFANPKYEEYLYQTNASIVIVDRDFIPSEKLNFTMIRVDDAYRSLSRLLQFVNSFMEKSRPTGVEQPSFIHPESQVHESVYVGAFAYIASGAVVEEGARIYPHAYIGEGCKIGSDSVIFSGAKIYKNCQIGKNCVIHSGTIIGSDGFGFAPQGGVYDKVPQLGNVVIHDDVEIGANCTIDRATMGSTEIEKGVKLDNLIQIAHNVVIGENTVIAAQTGVAGSSKIGKNCMIGGQVGIVGHLNIADGTKIAAQSGLNRDTNENDVLFGSPAFDYKQGLKASIVFQQLPEMKEKLNEITKKLDL